MTWRLGGGYGHEGKHLSADGEGERHDEQHEECHLCYKEQENLEAWMISKVRSRFAGSGNADCS